MITLLEPEIEENPAKDDPYAHIIPWTVAQKEIALCGARREGRPLVPRWQQPKPICPECRFKELS